MMTGWKILLYTLLGLFFSTAVGAEQFYLPLGSQGWFISKPVKNMRELRFKGIVPQHTDYSCGAAAMATILRYYFRDPKISEADIVRWLLANTDLELARTRGFSLLDLKHYALQGGYRADGFRVPLEKLQKISIPTIVLLTSKGYTHFVVLRGIRDEVVYLGDPALGNRHLDLDEFAESWNGLVFAVFGKGKNPDYDFFAGIPAVPRSEVWRLNDQLMRNLFISAAEFKSY